MAGFTARTPIRFFLRFESALSWKTMIGRVQRMVIEITFVATFALRRLGRKQPAD
jgi:hypothetical protein